MAVPVYNSPEDTGNYVRLTNGTGADLVQFEVTVIGKLPVIAQEAIASTAEGIFKVGQCSVHTDNLHASLNTFGTLGAPVFFDPTTKTIADTYQLGFAEIGALTKVKATAGDITFYKFDKVQPVLSGLADFAGTPTDNDTLKWVASTNKWTVVAV